MLNTNQITQNKVLLSGYSLKNSDFSNNRIGSLLSFGEKDINVSDNFTKEAKQLEIEAKKLGVRAKYGDNVFVAK